MQCHFSSSPSIFLYGFAEVMSKKNGQTSIFFDIASIRPYNLYMPRVARVVAAGYPHHITQRGNYRQKIFADDTDRRKYLSLLKEESKRYHLIILAYCLMSNHVHFMVIPQREDSMGKVFKYTNMKYSQYYNNNR